MSKKHFNFKSSIRDWYIRAFPSDQLGYRINPLATFAGAVKCMADGGDIYKYLGVGDSPVRENVFFKITALEERMGVGTGALSVQTEAGELIANAKEDGISVGIDIPGGKCADIAFVDADPDANDLYPTPVRAFTYNGRDEEPDHRTDVHLDGDMVLEGQLTAEAPAHLPGDVAAAAKEAAAKSVKPDTVGADGIKH